MKKAWSNRVACAAMVLVCFQALRARAAGFAIAEQGTSATGMVGAFTAKADDASAIFFNPAGLASQRGLQVYVGGLLVLGQPSVSGTSSFQVPDDQANLLVQGLPTVYLAYGFAHDISLGIGAFTNFGLKVDWPYDWSGKFVGTYVSLQTVTINPTFAWRPVRWLAIGAGLDLTPASVDLQRAVDLVGGEARLRFRGNELGIGGNVGILLQGPFLKNREHPVLSFGVSYRSAFDLDFDDGALTTIAPIEFSTTIRDSGATTRLRMPDQLSAGFGVRPVDHLFLQAQFDWVRWSRLQDLTLEVRDNPSQNLSLPQNFGSGYVLRIGGEVELGRWRPRLGVGYDWSPVPAQTLGPFIPDANRILVSAGLGVLDLPHRFAVELAAMGVIFQTRTSELQAFPVEYRNWAVLVSAAVSYRGDRPR